MARNVGMRHKLAIDRGGDLRTPESDRFGIADNSEENGGEANCFG